MCHVVDINHLSHISPLVIAHLKLRVKGCDNRSVIYHFWRTRSPTKFSQIKLYYLEQQLYRYRSSVLDNYEGLDSFRDIYSTFTWISYRTLDLIPPLITNSIYGLFKLEVIIETHFSITIFHKTVKISNICYFRY